jgi:hypothetical protein
LGSGRGVGYQAGPDDGEIRFGVDAVYKGGSLVQATRGVAVRVFHGLFVGVVATAGHLCFVHKFVPLGLVGAKGGLEERKELFGGEAVDLVRCFRDDGRCLHGALIKRLTRTNVAYKAAHKATDR